MNTSKAIQNRINHQLDHYIFTRLLRAKKLYFIIFTLVCTGFNSDYHKKTFRNTLKSCWKTFPGWIIAMLTLAIAITIQEIASDAPTQICRCGIPTFLGTACASTHIWIKSRQYQNYKMELACRRHLHGNIRICKLSCNTRPKTTLFFTNTIPYSVHFVRFLQSHLSRPISKTD